MHVACLTELLHQHFELGEKEPTNTVIFTDSKSTLEALEHPFENPHSDIQHLTLRLIPIMTILPEITKVLVMGQPPMFDKIDLNFELE